MKPLAEEERSSKHTFPPIPHQVTIHTNNSELGSSCVLLTYYSITFPGVLNNQSTAVTSPLQGTVTLCEPADSVFVFIKGSTTDGHTGKRNSTPSSDFDTFLNKYLW